MRRWLKIALASLLALGGLLLIGFVTGVIVVQTDWFKNKVRERIVSVAEQSTGGQVEIGKFNYDWHGLTAEVAPFVLHGKESTGEPPFFRADKIRVGLKIISALKKDVDILSLSVESPQVHIVVAPDGSTNVPAPKISRSQKNPIQQFLDLKVQRFEMRDGFAEYNSERIPLDLQGERLHASLAYDAAGPRYVGEISSNKLRIASPATKSPAGFDLYAKLALRANALDVEEANFTAGGLDLKVRGKVEDLASPHGAFEIAAALPVKDLETMFRLPLQPGGGLSFNGKGSFESKPFTYAVSGKLGGSGLAYVYGDTAVRNIAVSSRLEMTPARIDLPNLDVAALGGHFRGSGQVEKFKRFAASGSVEGFSLSKIAELGQRDSGELSGIVSGPVRLEAAIVPSGLRDLVVESKLDIVPGSAGVPVQGSLSVNYDQRAGKVRLGESQITLGSTRVNVAGTLGENLGVRAATRNFNDVLPALSLIGETAPEQLPVALHGGSASFDGVVSGPLDNPRISGRFEATKLALDRREFDRVTGTLDVDKTQAVLHSFNVQQGALQVEGQGRAGLQNWKLEEASPVSAALEVRGGDIQKLMADYGNQSLPVSGSLSAKLHATGTFESPLLIGGVELQNVTAYGEHFDSARADVTYTATALEITNGEARSGAARITGSGAYNHPVNDWADGSLRFDVAGARWSLAQIQHVQDFRKGLGGDIDGKAAGSAKVVKGEISLTSLNGRVALRSAVVDGRQYGNLEVTATTRLPVLNVSATVDFSGIQLKGSGEWRMEGDYQGQAQIQIPRITFATLHELAPGPHLRKDLPFEGFLQGEATVSGPLNKLDALRADVILNNVQVSAGPNVRPAAGTRREDLVLRNAQPVEISGTMKRVEIRSASFVAKDTTLRAAGRMSLDTRNPWDVSVNGRINLQILQIFNPDLLASGVSVISMAVRGSLTEPQVDGRVELRNASLFLRDLPNGVDQANGLILFDRNRATVQNLTAMTGGGNVTFVPGSFVGFRGAALVYRLQATAANVRYRSPDGISVTADASLSLMGTSDSSVLSGSVTVVRAAFNPRTDIGTLLASTAKPTALAEPNEYLRGIQFDVSVLTSRSLDVQTTLTRNIQADANLHLRGTPDRPVVLGGLIVNSGEIEFFGNKYTINRGQVNFYNPTKIEPIIDMDLETKVRGIVVDISFSGSLNKLNFSYRSDPPLETNEIIALLAVGRTPSTVGPLAASQTVQSTSYLATGSNALLGQAIAPATGRLQRFFGVSHIKIDPQLTDITAIPQARLTLEQQVSTDITLTYITNLAVTNQQIVRVQWDFSRRWSVVALRDENGAFSIDFQYRKRFK